MRRNNYRWPLFAVSMLASAASLADDRVFDKQFAAQPGGKLTISSDLGAIIITGSDSNEVVIHVALRGDRHFVDEFEITAESTDEGVAVRGQRSDYPWFDFFWFTNLDSEVRYTIQVPRNYQVLVRNSRGDVELRDFNGSAYGQTSRGNVLATGINGAVQIGASRGNVRASHIVGDLRVETSRGNVEVRNVVGPVELSSSRGAIDVELTSPNHGATLQTSRGNIHITVPREFAADLDVHTSRGETQCDLPISSPARARDRYHDGFSGSLNGTINGGGKRLRVETSRGDVHIRAAG
jgi:DUF4097 and DUF4098 domain-containing protein YvlB